jgi:hypothetical protein
MKRIAQVPPTQVDIRNELTADLARGKEAVPRHAVRTEPEQGATAGCIGIASQRRSKASTGRACRGGETP